MCTLLINFTMFTYISFTVKLLLVHIGIGECCNFQLYGYLELQAYFCGFSFNLQSTKNKYIWNDMYIYLLNWLPIFALHTCDLLDTINLLFYHSPHFPGMFILFISWCVKMRVICDEASTVLTRDTQDIVECFSLTLFGTMVSLNVEASFS